MYGYDLCVHMEIGNIIIEGMLMKGNQLPKQVDWPSNESKQSAHLPLTSVRLIHRRLNANEEHIELLYVLRMVFRRNRQRNLHVILHT